jgi:hypothetical protein
MQLDNTRIAIRERGVLELHDLAFQVMRTFFVPLLLTMALGVLPLMALNHLFIGWMSYELDYGQTYPARYLYNMSCLIIIEAPLASIFVTAYLGQAVFTDRPSIGRMVADVLRLLPRILMCNVVIRGIGLAWLFILFLRTSDMVEPTIEFLLMPSLLLFVGIVRGMRPFINEITILERNPLRSRNSTTMTVGRRSTTLHGPNGGMLFGRGIVSASFAAPLAWAVFGTCLFASGILFNTWRQGRIMIELAFPLSLWLVVLYFTIVRFLSYLDLRIRQEGWEVELLMRAESAKLTHRLS